MSPLFIHAPCQITNHGRNSSLSSTKGHARTPSTDHFMFPDRANTAAERRRRESLDIISPERMLVQQSSMHVHQHLESRQERHNRTRKLSSTETVYPSTDAAKKVLQSQRAANPNHRRAPTSHTSRRSRSHEGIQKMSSDRSIRSRVSFDSTRSRGSQRTIRSDLGYGSDDGYSTGINDPSFGITNEVCPMGEPVEMIGLGRKKPKHRVFQANMLKPALRSPTKLASRRTVDETNSGASWSERPDKPLPSRPISYVGPVMGSFSSLRDGIRSNIGTRSRYPSHEVHPRNYRSETGSDLPTKAHKPRASAHARSSSQPTGLGLRSLFSNISLSDQSFFTSTPFSSRHSLITPADDLLDYLRLAKVPLWDRWPGRGAKSGFWAMGTRKGQEEMSWEWHRRLEETDQARNSRALVNWKQKTGWQRDILDC